MTERVLLPWTSIVCSCWDARCCFLWTFLARQSLLCSIFMASQNAFYPPPHTPHTHTHISALLTAAANWPNSSWDQSFPIPSHFRTAGSWQAHPSTRSASLPAPKHLLLRDRSSLQKLCRHRASAQKFEVRQLRQRSLRSSSPYSCRSIPPQVCSSLGFVSCRLTLHFQVRGAQPWYPSRRAKSIRARPIWEKSASAEGVLEMSSRDKVAGYVEGFAFLLEGLHPAAYAHHPQDA